MDEDVESALVKELRALAQNESDSTFPLTIDGVTMTVTYSGGSSSSVTFEVPYDAFAGRERDGASDYRAREPVAAIRPMKISLDPERDAHRMGKQSGFDVEHQTGDAAFDEAVYVDAPSSEPLGRVLGPDVRDAVRALFALEFTSIMIDDDKRRVTARISAFTSLDRARAQGKPGLAAATAFAKLAAGLPHVTEKAGEHATVPLKFLTHALYFVAGIAFFGGAPLYFALIRGDKCGEDMGANEFAACIGPGVFGIALGLIAAGGATALSSGWVKARFRGRSDSSRNASALSAAIFASVLFVVALLLSMAIAKGMDH